MSTNWEDRIWGSVGTIQNLDCGSGYTICLPKLIELNIKKSKFTVCKLYRKNQTKKKVREKRALLKQHEFSASIYSLSLSSPCPRPSLSHPHHSPYTSSPAFSL